MKSCHSAQLSDISKSNSFNPDGNKWVQTLMSGRCRNVSKAFLNQKTAPISWPPSRYTEADCALHSEEQIL